MYLELGKYICCRKSTANTIVTLFSISKQPKAGKFELIKQIQIFLPLICSEKLNGAITGYS